MIEIRDRDGGVTIECRITPRASREKIRGERDGALEIALNAPPVDGRANSALIELLAKTLGVRKSAISIVGGEHARKKIVFVDGLSRNRALEILSDILG